MEAYTSFAQVYDLFMDNIPYDEWSRYLKELLVNNGVERGIILELGCGTGSITRRLKNYGYNMIGIDNSEEMLTIARNNDSEDILYLLQDMREFELYGTVSAVVSICDSINYIMSEEDLLKVFILVNNYLEKDGVFIFDLNTEYKYKDILGESTIAENRDQGSFIWDNYYYEDEKVNEYELTLYIKKNLEKNNEESEEVFNRYEETHYQKAYSIEKIKELLVKAGMEFVAVYDAFSFDEPKKDSERVYIIAKEGFQKEKKYT